MRTLRFAGLVGLLGGGAGELSFRRVLLPTFPGWTYDVALRTIFDQMLFAPAVLAWVVAGTALLTTNGDTAYARHKLDVDFVHSLGDMWKLWCGGAAFNYLVVPTPWQPPATSLLMVVWAFYVSRRVHLPTMRHGFSEQHSPERIGAYIRDEQSRAEW